MFSKKTYAERRAVLHAINVLDPFEVIVALREDDLEELLVVDEVLDPALGPAHCRRLNPGTRFTGLGIKVQPLGSSAMRIRLG